MNTAYFIVNHLVEFISKVFKYLQNNLTLDKCLFAWREVSELIHCYKTKLLPMLKGTKLLNHIVNDLCIVQQVLSNESAEEVDRVKHVLCGEEMTNVMNLLHASDDQIALRFYIEQVLKDAKALRLIYEDSLRECAARDEFNLQEFNAEFCKQFDLKICRMDEFVLYSIRKAALDDKSYMEAYRLYRSKPENNFAELLVCNSFDGISSIESYIVPAPCNNIDQDTCMQFAQTFDSQNNEYTNYQYTQPISNGSILYSMSAFSIKIVFFYVSTENGFPSLNVTFYRDSQ